MDLINERIDEGLCPICKKIITDVKGFKNLRCVKRLGREVLICKDHPYVKEIV